MEGLSSVVLSLGLIRNPSPGLIQFCAANAFWVTWSERVLSQIRHENALTYCSAGFHDLSPSDSSNRSSCCWVDKE